MIKTTSTLVLLVAIGLLSGCAAKYQCKLGNECVDVYDNYDAAVNQSGNKETVTPDANKDGVPFKSAGAKAKGFGVSEELGLQSFEPYSGGAMTEKPIYQPPRPLRIWIAPWQAKLDSQTQSEAVLMSGQFMYATIPGSWTMGELREDGSLSNVLLLAPYDKEKEEKATPKRIQPKKSVLDLSTPK